MKYKLQIELKCKKSDFKWNQKWTIDDGLQREN